MKILIGADPEVFLHNAAGDIVSGYGIIPGTKRNPHKVPFGAIQLDGMAAEFNIDPASTAEEFVHNISTVKKELFSYLPSGWGFATRCTHTFSPEYMAQQPEATLVLGCDPDFDGQTQQQNILKVPVDGLRTVAGHVHVGWEGAEEEDTETKHCNAATVARQLDFFLGMHDIIYSHPDSWMRRTLYGRASAYRPKSYGMEYRTPSNYWIFSEKLMTEVFNLTQAAFNRMMTDKDDLTYINGAVAANAIRHHDRRSARSLLKAFYS